MVIGGTIDKYIYVQTQKLLPMFEYKSRIQYSEVETVQNHRDIKHRVFRTALEKLNFDDPLDITTAANIPSKIGIGSSSAFIVSLLLSLNQYRGVPLDKTALYLSAVNMEQNWLEETVGLQDTAMSTFGGFNVIRWDWKNWYLNPKVVNILSGKALKSLESHLVLFYTGITRRAEEIAKSYISRATTNKLTKQIVDLAERGLHEIVWQEWENVGKLLKESWNIKRTLSPSVTNSKIDEICEAGLNAGSFGMKLLGAGGGGCVLFVCPPEKQAQLRQSLSYLTEVPFTFESSGAQVFTL